MFGISLGEITVVLIVALVVFGPEEATKYAKLLGRIFAKGQRIFNEFRATLDKEE